MQLHESSHDRQTETESSSRPVGRWIGLPKRLKDCRERRGVNADACVGDLDPGMSIGVLEGDRDASTGRCKFDRIPHQVPENLLQPDAVATDRYIFNW